MPTEAAARLFVDLASYDVITEMIANGEAKTYTWSARRQQHRSLLVTYKCT